ncbi:MAG: hypothetical protein QN122_12130 [Armatimonadota bacterium]|nr:hypothetical protein [Armatimonadota bacterium]
MIDLSCRPLREMSQPFVVGWFLGWLWARLAANPYEEVTEYLPVELAPCLLDLAEAAQRGVVATEVEDGWLRAVFS